MLRNLKINFSIVAAMLALTAAFAFTPANKVGVTYYFNGNNSTEIKTVSQWSDSPSPGCTEVAELPCALTIDEPLADFLDNHSVNEITDASSSKRAE